LNWTVFDDPMESDHLLIIISITNKCDKVENKV